MSVRDGILFVLIGLVAASASADNWPRFRGANGSGLAAAGSALPTEIGPDKSIVWKVELPPVS